MTSTRVLIVADRTANSSRLMRSVADRAAGGPCTFTLLIPAARRGPRRVSDPAERGVAAAERRLGAALPLLSTAAGSEVVGMVGAADPLVAVRESLKVMEFDEVMVSLLPAPSSEWARIELPRKIRELGVPVIEVTAGKSDCTPLPAA